MSRTKSLVYKDLTKCLKNKYDVLVVPPNPFRGMGIASPQRSKMEVVPKMARRGSSDAGFPGRELDLAVHVRRRCKNSHSINE